MSERSDAATAVEAFATRSIGAGWARRAYLAIALLFAAIVTWGSWQSYFGPLLAGTVDRPWVVHLHAAVFVGWVLLLVAQAALVVAGRVRLHRQIGAAGMLYRAVVFSATSARPCCAHLSELPALFYDSSRLWTEGWPATA